MIAIWSSSSSPRWARKVVRLSSRPWTRLRITLGLRSSTIQTSWASPRLRRTLSESLITTCARSRSSLTWRITRKLRWGSNLWSSTRSCVWCKKWPRSCFLSTHITSNRMSSPAFLTSWRIAVSNNSDYKRHTLTAIWATYINLSFALITINY